MHVVRLLAMDGGLITEIAMPQFDKMPEVVIWGSRVFVYEYIDAYKEVFAYVVPSGTEVPEGTKSATL